MARVWGLGARPDSSVRHTLHPLTNPHSVLWGQEMGCRVGGGSTPASEVPGLAEGWTERKSLRLAERKMDSSVEKQEPMRLSSHREQGSEDRAGQGREGGSGRTSRRAGAWKMRRSREGQRAAETQWTVVWAARLLRPREAAEGSGSAQTSLQTWFPCSLLFLELQSLHFSVPRFLHLLPGAR